jgi:hypothetical protein
MFDDDRAPARGVSRQEETMSRLGPTAGVVIAGLVLWCAGCGPSNWERSFTPEGEAPALASAAPVRLREVPWERLEAALVKLDAERAASDAPPDEWPQDKKDAAKQELLRALQVTTPIDGVEILGRSAFRTTWQTSPTDGELEALARKKGANLVVWSSNYLGKTQVVRDEPVTEWRTGSYYAGRDRRSRTYTENSTIWVPVVVEADEHAFMAYFLRE